MSILKRPKLRLTGGRECTDIEFVGSGGSGEVYRGLLDGRPVALKLFLPLDERRQLSVLNKDLATTHMATLVTQSLDFQRREYQFVSRISHPNIVRALDAFSLDLSKAERDTLKSELDIDGVIQVPALLSEFVDGLALDKAVVQFNLSADEVAYALTRVAEALDYLHTHHNYLHTDVKPSNVLVRGDIREPVLIDFALSKNFDFSQVAPGDATRLFGDLFPHLPEDHPLTRAKADGATREDFRRLAFPYLDLYQFGLMLKGLESATAQVFEERELRYLAVLQFELSDWERVSTWEPGQLADRVRRLSPSLSTPFGVTELAAPGVTERTIVLPDGQGAPITDVIAPVIATRSFGRLATVNQLSLLDVVYPGAGYKRSVHVLSSYELARQLAGHLYASPRFRYLFDRRAVQQLLLVALLHDINHFPFLHTLQESEVEEVAELQLFDLLCDGELTGEKAAGEPSVYDILESYDLSPDRFKRLVYQGFDDQECEVDQVISSIVNSGVDVDKLSYLRLDAHFTGVPYGRAIDVQTLLKAATVAPIERRFHLAYGERAISALEQVVFARFWNFRTIYWHHTNRALMAMVLSVVRDVYAGRPGVTDYLRQTLFSGEWAAMRYLDAEHRRHPGGPSILDGLEHDRGLIYKRLYSLHPASDENDDRLLKALRKLPAGRQLAVRARIAQRLADLLGPSGLKGRELGTGEVLVDIPRRDLDIGGNVFVHIDGRARKLIELSKPVEHLNAHYSDLSQRARVFVAPWVREQLRLVQPALDRERIRSLISEAARDGGGPGEVH